MKAMAKIDKGVAKRVPKASQILIDYEYWLKKHYGVTGAYLINAKSFLRTYEEGGDVQSQLHDYISLRGPSLRSILSRFLRFIESRSINIVINDLNDPVLPLSNIYVKLFLTSIEDRLHSRGSIQTYATILNGYFQSIKDDISRINKRTATKYIHAPILSDYTKRLYRSVLKAFCEWVLSYQVMKYGELTREQRIIKRALNKISIQSLKEIVSIKVRLPRSVTTTYHKDSLTEKQRLRLLMLAKSQRDRAIISLMAWNGLRSIEILRLNFGDIKLTQGRISIWGKGKSEKSKDTIKLSGTAKREVRAFLRKSKIKRARLFEMKRSELDDLIKVYLKRLRVGGRLTPHSLRHTAGQLMYEKNIPLEIVQKTLRHADIRTTMIYSQKAIDRQYFARLRKF